MPKEADLSANECVFILEALRANIRLDGRSLDQHRRIAISFGDDYGHVRVQLGDTSVIVKVSAAVSKPRPERESDGIFTVAVELNDMAFPGFETGRQSEQETQISRTLDKIIRRSNALDTESLCLAKGLSCWHVRVDAHIVDADGGLIDTCCIAIMTALLHFRLPESTVRDGRVTVYSLEERVPVQLNLTKLPLSITFNIYDEGRITLIDATSKEESISEGTLIVALDKTGEVSLLSKAEGTPADALSLVACADLALVKVKELNKVILQKLEEDMKIREKAHPTVEANATNDRVL